MHEYPAESSSDRLGRRLKLYDLHVFLTVAELGDIGKAAERLAISQPSISKAVADIEHAIGVRLLDRARRGVELTACWKPVPSSEVLARLMNFGKI